MKNEKKSNKKTRYDSAKKLRKISLILALILIAVTVAEGIVFALLLSAYNRIDMSSEAYSEVMFVKHSFEKKRLCLYEENDDVPYVISDPEACGVDADKLLSDTDRRIFKVGYIERGKGEKAYREITALRRMTGDEYLTVQKSEAAAKTAYKKVMTAFEIWAGIVIALLAAALIAVKITEKNTLKKRGKKYKESQEKIN